MRQPTDQPPSKEAVQEVLRMQVNGKSVEKSILDGTLVITLPVFLRICSLHEQQWITVRDTQEMLRIFNRTGG